MTREEHKEHSDDFAKGNISAGAFVLFQQIRIDALEAQIKNQTINEYMIQEAIKETFKQAVIEHHKNGGEVEYRRKLKGNNAWFPALDPIFNFDLCDYRIKETLKTKTVWFWKGRFDDDSWCLSTWMYTEEEIKEEWVDALEYKRMDILGSEEVPNG